MSRTLEILEQLEEDQELFRLPPGPSQLSATGLAAVASHEFGREGLLALALRLFLSADSDANSSPRQVVFCGVDQPDGTSKLCASLGRILASQVASQVCVVDANVRAPVVHRFFNLQWTEGEVPPQSNTEPQLLQQVANNLWLISSHSAAQIYGVTASLEQVRSQIRDLSPHFAHMVINAPPAGLYNDAGLLGQRTDGVVLVLEANSTRRAAARKAKQALEAANVRVLGTVLNNRTFPIPEKIYRLL
jgi:Mrp family chromosome partitioning ATPase